tara:strand:- start:192 stop:383 length:192 start_codon:yes stop_codon:yes gene_type:complete
MSKQISPYYTQTVVFVGCYVVRNGASNSLPVGIYKVGELPEVIQSQHGLQVQAVDSTNNVVYA